MSCQAYINIELNGLLEFFWVEIDFVASNTMLFAGPFTQVN